MVLPQNLDIGNPLWFKVDPGLSIFWTDGSDPHGLYGQYGSGRIVFSSVLAGSAVRGASGSAGNDYQLMLNEIRWVGQVQVPEPGSLGIFAAVGALGLARHRRKT